MVPKVAKAERVTDGGHPRMDRRRFLASASASLCLLAAHGHRAWAVPATGKGIAEAPRILHLRLLTAAPFAMLKDFYRGILGLKVLAESPERLTLGAGPSRLTFEHAGPSQPDPSDGGDRGEPFYHVAFNIPENKIRAARDWLAARTPLVPTPEHMLDPPYPDDVRHFRNWNAHAVFFWDPAGNLLELIARHDLDNAAPGPFTAEDLLYISEIAFIVDDVPATAGELGRELALAQYRRASDVFHALGDENGLLLLMKRGRVWAGHTDRAKATRVFPTTAAIRAARPVRVTVPGFPYEISAG